MAILELKSIRKSFGSVDVIRDMNLPVKDGELLVFVGPSAGGKSTMLRLIAGLETVSEGQISTGGKIAMVFQCYALYPHTDMRGNPGFALKHAGVNQKEIDERVNVAGFIGSPAMNRLTADVPGSSVKLACSRTCTPATADGKVKPGLRGAICSLGLRPEHCHVFDRNDNRIAA